MDDELSLKQKVINAIARLPDDATIEDICYSVYVIQGIEAGLADVRAGRTIAHEDVVRSLRIWLETGNRSFNA